MVKGLNYKEYIDNMEKFLSTISGYKIDRDYGIISTPGKFKGEMYFVPYFWDMALEGDFDEDTGEIFTFHITPSDRAFIPDLKGAKKIELYEDGQGFIHSEVK